MTDTRELARTRNGAKVMERTLEAAAARIKELEDALLWNASALQHYVKAADDERSTIKLLKTGQKKKLKEILDTADALLEKS